MLSKAAYRHLSRMTSLAELASFLKANAPKTRKSVKLARGRKQKKDAEPRFPEDVPTDVLRPLLEKRSDWLCECGCGRPLDAKLYTRTPEMDHFYGRAREPQTPETCWLITRLCHWHKSHHSPDRQTWDDRFHVHCERHGLPFKPRLVKASLPEKQAVK
jgi:hypothetical protein